MSIYTDSTISNVYSNYAASLQTNDKANNTKTDETKSSGSTKKTGSYGKTIGNVKLSEEAAKYYEQLKNKFSNMDFILVSADQKANAQANAASYANSSKMVVLIDEDKIERMATDESYRKQYEAIISNASSGISQLKTSIESSGLSSRVQGYGMSVNDGGTASFFAVLKKSSADQKARIEKKAEEKKEEKKAEEKKAEKEEREERLQKAREEDDDTDIDLEDTVTITASSIEELIQKLNDYALAEQSDYVQTDYEKAIGQNIDYRG
jgi:hypothetical protein